MAREHLGWPFGSPPTDQDSQQEVRDCVAVAASYRPGRRPGRPRFGAEPAAFRQGGVDLAGLAGALRDVEPRAVPLLSGNDPAMMVAVRATRVRVEV